MKLLHVRTPTFAAGAVWTGGGWVKVAPILNYIRPWSLEYAVLYFRSRKFEVYVTDMPDVVEAQ